MKTLYTKTALLPTGWATNVLIEIDPSGFIHRVAANMRPGGVFESLPGPLIAGVVNAHSHVWQRLFAGKTETHGDFWAWRQQMYRYAHKLRPEQLHAVAAQTYVDMLKSGYTAVGEFHYLHHDERGIPYINSTEMSDQVIAAAIATGIRITHLPVLYQYSNFGGKKPSTEQRRFVHTTDAFIDLLQNLMRKYERHNTVTIGWAPHSLRAVGSKSLAKVLSECNQPVHIHIAEQPKEVADCVAWSGERPVAWLLNNFDVNSSWCLVHATHIQARELRALAKTQATVAVAPSTEANLGDGVFQAEKYLALGGQIAIGSDSHISIDPAEELRLLEYGQRLLQGRRGVLASEAQASVGQNLYECIQQGGQRSLGYKTGVIARGAPADLVVLDGDSPMLQGKEEHQILDTWIFSGGRELVRDVMTAGKWQVKDGRHVREAEIAQQYVQAIATI